MSFLPTINTKPSYFYFKSAKSSFWLEFLQHGIRAFQSAEGGGVVLKEAPPPLFWLDASPCQTGTEDSQAVERTQHYTTTLTRSFPLRGEALYTVFSFWKSHPGKQDRKREHKEEIDYFFFLFWKLNSVQLFKKRLWVCMTQAWGECVVMVTDTCRLTPDEDWMLNGHRPVVASQRE